MHQVARVAVQLALQVGQQRPAQLLGQGRNGGRLLRVIDAPHHDYPALPGEGGGPCHRQGGRSGLPGAPGGIAVLPARKRRQVVAGLHGRAGRVERFAVAAVEVHRARQAMLLRHGLVDRAEQIGGGNLAAGGRQVVVRHRVAGEDIPLVDGLVTAVIQQLDGPVGRQNHQRHAQQRGFHHGRIKVGHRRAGRGDHRHRLLGTSGQAQRHEPQPALVEVSMAAQPGVLAGRHGQRGGARARRHDYFAQPPAVQLFQQQRRPNVVKGGVMHRLIPFPAAREYRQSWHPARATRRRPATPPRYPPPRTGGSPYR